MITIYTDGATEGPNGKLGTVIHCGLGFYCPEKEYRFSKRVRAISNNEAEFLALIEAMKWALENGHKSVRFRCDSMIVINRATSKMNRYKKNGKSKNERMDKFQDTVLELAAKFDVISFFWVPREENTEADIQSKLAVTPTNPYQFSLVRGH